MIVHRTLGLLALASLSLLGCPSPASVPPIGARAALELAATEIAADRPLAAIGALRAHLADAPDDALARASLAHALLEHGDLEGSIVQGKLALGVDPGFASAAYNLACAYARVGAPDEAIRWLQVAFASPEFGRDDLLGDEDLATLREDHRVAVYFASGVLSRAEADAVAAVDRERVRVGDTLLLSVALIQLNRPLLSEATAELLLGADNGLAAFGLLERAETFTRGSAGDREYLQRIVQFTLRADAPGPVRLGPFVVTADGVEHRTVPLTVVVEGGDSEGRGGGADRGFGFPSVLDRATIAAFDAADPGPRASVEPAPRSITLPDGLVARLLRFRALSVEIPAPAPPRPQGAVRSSFVRRSTEGASWVLDRWSPTAG